MRRNIIASLALFSATVFALFAAVNVTAQISNPPCAFVTVINTTTCPAWLTFATAPAGGIPRVTVPGGGTVNIPIPVGTTITGMFSAIGNNFPFQPPPAPAGFGCATTTSWWIAHMLLGPTTACCFDICLNPATCTITLLASPVPPACNM